MIYDINIGDMCRVVSTSANWNRYECDDEGHPTELSFYIDEKNICIVKKRLYHYYFIVVDVSTNKKFVAGIHSIIPLTHHM